MADITYRDEKGSDLTAEEVDANNRELEARIALKPDTVNVRSIASITKSGNTILVTYNDASTDGPFTLPVQKLRWRGEWDDDTTYQANDLVLVSTHDDTVDGSVELGVYILLQDTPVAATFDPEVEIGGDPVYDLYSPLVDVDLFPPVISFGAVITTSQTMALADRNLWFNVNFGALTEITIPPVADVAWTQGDVLIFEDMTGNQIEIIEGSGVTVNPPEDATRLSRGQFSAITLTYEGGDVWNLGGDLELI